MTTLYDYWRSSASYRVRIALNMLGEAYETVSVDLLAGEHKTRRTLPATRRDWCRRSI